ncbi:hypothetical protein [Micromonospora sp. NPDC049891]|uniref:hypothetical protein n=1 Tax=Micromonospora sp. NPDC049891 TaxID=3155655 RepID=UPI0033EA4662
MSAPRTPPARRLDAPPHGSGFARRLDQHAWKTRDSTVPARVPTTGGGFSDADRTAHR